MFTSEKKEYFTVPPLTFKQEVILALCNNIDKFFISDNKATADCIVNLAEEIVKRSEQ